MLDKLESLDFGPAGLGELVALSAFGKGLQAEYAALQVSPPEWLAVRLKEISREVKARNADALDKRLRELKRQREGLEDAATKRQRIEDEIKQVEAAISA